MPAGLLGHALVSVLTKPIHEDTNRGVNPRLPPTFSFFIRSTGSKQTLNGLFYLKPL
jgi:hypothetical protein